MELNLISFLMYKSTEWFFSHLFCSKLVNIVKYKLFLHIHLFFLLILLVGGSLLYNIVVVFVIPWHESAMDLHVSPILNPPSPHPSGSSQCIKLVLEKAEEPEIKLPTSTGSLKKQESSSKTSISALLTIPKPLTVWVTINCGKVFKRWEYQITWPASWETCVQVRKQQLELDMEQQNGSKQEKEYVRAVYCHLLI